MDIGLVLRILVYIMGGVLPFIYNYYYVRKKVKEGKNDTEETSEGNSIVVSGLTYSSELRSNVGAEPGKVTGESIEPITIVSSTSIVSPHAYDDRSGSNPLYVVLLIDHNVMRNPDALTKMVLNVPKIVSNIESKLNKR